MMNPFISHSYGYSMNPWGFFGLGPIALIFIGLAFVIGLILKGYALWHAAKRDEKWWFIALLIINTSGILELVYLIFVVKKWPQSSTTPVTPPAPGMSIK